MYTYPDMGVTMFTTYDLMCLVSLSLTSSAFYTKVNPFRVNRAPTMSNLRIYGPAVVVPRGEGVRFSMAWDGGALACTFKNMVGR